MEEDQLEMVKFLIERGADVNAETIEDQFTPINIAKMTLSESNPIIEFLIQAGAEDNDVYVDQDGSEEGEEEEDGDDDDDDDDDEEEEAEENEL